MTACAWRWLADWRGCGLVQAPRAWLVVAVVGWVVG